MYDYPETVQKLINVRHLPTDAHEVLGKSLANTMLVLMSCYPNGQTVEPELITPAHKELIELGVINRTGNKQTIHPAILQKQKDSVAKMNDLLRRVAEEIKVA